ncbi:MAG: hypothetical protein AAF763_08245 [Pseudomonadota bacterium]
MTHDWMIDVLADLRQYAIRNYYLELAEQIDDAIVVAAVELRRAPSDARLARQPEPEPEDGPRSELRPA